MGGEGEGGENNNNKQQAIDGEIKMRFDNMANGLRENNLPLPVKHITMLNQSAVYMCNGQMEQAR